MIIESLVVGAFAENCYVVGCDKSREAVVIDPGDEFSRIWRVVAEKELTVRSILLTHGHLDHVLAVEALHEKTGAPVFMHPDDQFLLDSLPQQAAAFGLQVASSPRVSDSLKEGDTVEFGTVRFEVLHTPGHSPGSVTFVTEGIAFVGDALFAGSIGRTDLPGGDYATLIKSIKEKLLVLSEATYVYPGHGEATTIGREKASNPFLVA